VTLRYINKVKWRLINEVSDNERSNVDFMVPYARALSSDVLIESERHCACAPTDTLLTWPACYSLLNVIMCPEFFTEISENRVHIYGATAQIGSRPPHFEGSRPRS
jgi:hypothetical protein